MGRPGPPLAVLLILLNGALGHGDTNAERSSFSAASANGKFVFVMLAPIQAEADGIKSRPEHRKEIQNLRSKYRVSGLYVKDGSATPMWTVSWYAYSVIVASDGVHLVRQGPWAEGSSTEAFSLFRNGKEIRTYRVGDLVDTTLTLPHTVSHFVWAQSMRLDDSTRILYVTTLNKDRYAIDITTGNVIRAYRPMRIAASITASIVAVAIAVIVLRRRQKRLLSGSRWHLTGTNEL